MKNYRNFRWVLSQMVALLGSRRRFISLSLPAARVHRLFDVEKKALVRIRCRGSEDVVSIIQVFFAEFYELSQIGPRCSDIMNDYAAIIKSGKRPLIVDCGANIGLTCVYLAMLFPQAKIVAIEPDEMNCDFAKENTCRYDVDVIRAAIGCERGVGGIVDQSVDSNSFRIERQVSGSPGAIDVITIQDVLERYPDDMYVPLMIKIDIEGFEEDLFSGNVEWIRFFKLMIVELHDWMLPGKGSSRNFLREISKLNRDFLFHNENIFSVQNEA